MKYTYSFIIFLLASFVGHSQALNDECTGRETIAVNTSEAIEYSLDTSMATESLDTSCENVNTQNLDVWYEFTMPVNGNLRITDIPNTIGITIFDNCGGNEVACFFNDGFVFNLSEATTYVLRVSENSIFAGPTSFNIQAFETATNDECTSPTDIIVLQETNTTFTVDNRTATESMDASCENANNQNLDLWYEFIMPVNGTIEITNVGSSESFSLFEECSGEELDCFFNDGSFFELISGNSYVLRVSTSTIFSGVFDFTIQAIEVAPQPCTDSTIWDGNSWSNGIPDNTTTALFNGNYNTAFEPENINACSCTIATGRTVTIGDGFYLRSVFDIIVEGSLEVSNAGSIIQVAEDAITINNGAISISKTTPTLQPRDFILLASPMSQEVNGEVYGNSNRVFGIIEENFIPNTDPDLNAVVGNFIDDNGDYLDNLEIDDPNMPDDQSGTMTPIVPGTGYLVFPQGVDVVGGVKYNHTYTEGTLNSGSITRTTTYNGPATGNNFNLLGNPYASAIDVHQFIQNNDPVNEVFYWEHITEPNSDLPGFNNQNFSMDDVSVLNLTGGIPSVNGGTAPGQFMASGQGFAILADQNFAGTDVNFTNSIRVTGNNSTPRSPDQSNRIWLQLSNDTYNVTARALIGFFPEGSPVYDFGYDSDRLNTSINLFSVLDNDRQLSIQAREVFNPEMEINMGLSSLIPEDLNVTINIDQIEGVDLQLTDIYLIDHYLKSSTNLKSTSYSFKTEKGVQADRFTLVFKEPSLTIEEESFRESSIGIYPNPAFNQVTIDYNGSIPLTQVTLLNTSGKVVRTFNLTEFNGKKNLDLEGISSGMYFINIKSIQDSIIKKLLIK